jgi:para-nitrobenzyl esterase
VARAVVDTAYGKVSGATVDGVTAFLGVPFASTGPGRRFRPASPPERWTGIREAQAPGPMAPQQRTDFSNVMPDEFQELGGLGFGVDPPPQDEDCLGLSVWTPGADAEPRPVMVWMHGAPFNSGSNSMGEGASLARTGDVVVVMPNHRLGVLGFLHLDSVAPGAYPGSGNMGMLDLVRSLEWVRDNISNFGGDAGNVTVFGCSGGGMKTSTLLAMPAARGLFHKAIIESGPYVRAVPAERATTYANRFLRALDLEATAVDELERLPVERLVAAQEQVLKELQAEAIGFGDLAAAGPEVFVRGVAHGGPLWDIGPTVDGAVLTQQPWDPAAPPSAAEVPLIIGLNRDEGALWLMMYPNVNDLSWDQLESMATALRAIGARPSSTCTVAPGAATPRTSSTPSSRPTICGWTRCTSPSARSPAARRRCGCTSSPTAATRWAAGCGPLMVSRSPSCSTTSSGSRPPAPAPSASRWPTP